VTRRDLATLALLAAIWGASFMFIRVAVRELEPAVLVFFRLLLASLTLLAVLPFQMPVGEAIRRIRDAAGRLAVVGAVNATLPFWLLSWAETRIDSGLAAVLQAAAPLWTALLAYFFFHSERVSGERLVGVVVGFGGVALLVGVTPRGSVLAALAVVATALCYALGALLAGRILRGLPALVIALGTTAFATVFAAPAGLAQLPAHAPGWKTIGSVLTLGILGLGLAYLLYFVLIAGPGASRAMLVTYIVPPIALFYGAVILGEPITGSAIAGLVLILGGVALGTGNVRAWRRRTADSLQA
jgi:drug/metabolite transporter (DMT)-like permease